MSRDRTRRFFLGGLTAMLAPGAVWASPPQVSLRPRARGADLGGMARGGVDGLIARAGLSGNVVCAVADVKTGLELEASGGGIGLPPASVAKALTALYALEILGPDHRFATRLLTTAPVENGVLNGDLILAGGGDPVLDTDDLAALAAALRAAGVREIRGAFQIYGGALPAVHSIDPEQPDHLGYSPAVSGLALNFNRVHFEWKRRGQGYSVTMDARTGKYRPDVEMTRMKVVARGQPIYTYVDKDNIDQWTVAKKALGAGGARWLPVRHPGAYAGDVFGTMARAHGVVLKPGGYLDRLPSGCQVLAQHQSPPLLSILGDMLKYSTNLTAEMVGMSTTIAAGGQPHSLRDSAARMSRWAAQRYGMSATLLVDHSGLGGASRMTAQDLVAALIAAKKQDLLRPILKPFGMRDASGRVVRNHPIQVAAKTGTLNFVSGLGGYMTTADGTELAFAIFAADTERRDRIPRAQRERPDGARAWNRRAKALQRELLERWGALYGS